MSPSESEFTALRATIASRGTVRMALLPAVIFAWATLAIVVILFGDLPVAALPPLAVLVGGFETINALHVGVERIGRFLQVFYEGQPGGPAWESTAMAAFWPGFMKALIDWLRPSASPIRCTLPNNI